MSALPRRGVGAIATVLALVAGALPAAGQARPDGEIWRGGRPLAPLSRTAQSITGPIRIGARTMTFGRRTVAARPLGSSREAWVPFLPHAVQLATLFELGADPGPLIRRNTLCGGSERAHYAVVHQEAGISGPVVSVGIWAGAAPPENGTSPHFCGSLSYVSRR